MLNFEDLYESYVTEVYHFAYWLSGNRSEAEDITSETFVQAWVKRNNIRTETLRAYLFTIARNVFLQQQRRRKHLVNLEEDYSDPAPGPLEKVEIEFELLRVQKSLRTLPEIDRAAFILRVQHELPYAEIARVLQLSLSSVKVKVHRVRKKLIAACVDKEVI
jgi:RNA polymerase sigma factor (sigma-70 family)